MKNQGIWVSDLPKGWQKPCACSVTFSTPRSAKALPLPVEAGDPGSACPTGATAQQQHCQPVRAVLRGQTQPDRPGGTGKRNTENSERPELLQCLARAALTHLVPAAAERNLPCCWGSCRNSLREWRGKSGEGSSIHFPCPMQHRDFLLSLTILFPLLWSMTSRGPRGNISFQTGTWTMRKDALSNNETENISVFITTSRNAARPQTLVSVWITEGKTCSAKGKHLALSYPWEGLGTCCYEHPTTRN